LAACNGGDDVENDGNGEKNEPATEAADQEKDNEQENEEDEQKDDEIYFDGEVAEIDDVKIEIKETKVIPAGEEGNEHGDSPVFAI